MTSHRHGMSFYVIRARKDIIYVYIFKQVFSKQVPVRTELSEDFGDT